MNHNHKTIQYNLMGFYLLFQRFGLQVGLHQGMLQCESYAIRYKIVLHVCLHSLLCLQNDGLYGYIMGYQHLCSVWLYFYIGDFS